METDIIIILLIIALPLVAQIKIKLSYSKYSKKICQSGLTGKDVAEKILEKNGIGNVNIYQTSGQLTDHYDPRSKSVSLSENIYSKNSISAIAVAAHECGHAIQDNIGYSFLRLRHTLIPIVNITSTVSSVFIFLGFITEFLGLLQIGIILLSVGLVFQLITLPVEFDASRRAKIELESLGLISSDEINGTKKVLRAAALTYVAGFLASALQILRLVLMTRRRN